MAAFIASYSGPTGQPRTVTVKAADLAEAKKLLRRRGIRAEELRPVSPGNNQDPKTDGADAGGLKSIDLNRMFERRRASKRKPCSPASWRLWSMPAYRSCAASI